MSDMDKEAVAYDGVLKALAPLTHRPGYGSFGAGGWSSGEQVDRAAVRRVLNAVEARLLPSLTEARP